MGWYDSTREGEPKPEPGKDAAKHQGRNRIAVGVAVFVVVAAVLSWVGGGGSEASHTVSYKVTGTAASASLTLSDADGDTVQLGQQPLPWTSNDLSVKEGGFLYVSAQNDGDTGSVRCAIVVDGTEEKASESAGAYTICSASERLGG